MLDFNPKIILPDGLIDCDERLIEMVLDAATNVHLLNFNQKLMKNGIKRISI